MKTGTYQNNRRPGDGWTVTAAGGPFGLPCTAVKEARSHFTELRLSEREFYLFKPKLINLAAVVGGCVGTVAFERVSGSAGGGTLQPLGNTQFIYTADTVLTEFDGDLGTGTVMNPQRYLLITADGRTIDFDRQAGITRIQDRNANTLSITPGWHPSQRRHEHRVPA